MKSGNFREWGFATAEAYVESIVNANAAKKQPQKPVRSFSNVLALILLNIFPTNPDRGEFVRQKLRSLLPKKPLQCPTMGCKNTDFSIWGVVLADDQPRPIRYCRKCTNELYRERNYDSGRKPRFVPITRFRKPHLTAR